MHSRTTMFVERLTSTAVPAAAATAAVPEQQPIYPTTTTTAELPATSSEQQPIRCSTAAAAATFRYDKGQSVISRRRTAAGTSFGHLGDEPLQEGERAKQSTCDSGGATQHEG